MASSSDAVWLELERSNPEYFDGSPLCLAASLVCPLRSSPAQPTLVVPPLTTALTQDNLPQARCKQPEPATSCRPLHA